MFASSALETRIIAGFLEAADYETVDFSTWTSANQQPAHTRFDAAVLVLDEGESNLAAKSAQLREAAKSAHLPIVVVMTQYPTEPVEALNVLLRPIRLFDLVHAVDLAVADSRRADSSESPSFHHRHA